MRDDVAKRSGWITFGGVMAVLAGDYNALSGIAARGTCASESAFGLLTQSDEFLA